MTTDRRCDQRVSGTRLGSRRYSAQRPCALGVNEPWGSAVAADQDRLPSVLLDALHEIQRHTGTTTSAALARPALPTGDTAAIPCGGFMLALHGPLDLDP